MDDTQVIEPISTEVQFGGRAVTVRPLTVGQIPRFMRAIKPIMPSLTDAAQAVDGGSEEMELDLDLTGLVTEHGDTIIEAVAIATGLPLKEVQDAQPDEFMTLAAAVVKVNADFFVRRLAPALQAALGSATAAAKAATSGAGQTPSKP